jgi:hypothetical protein
MVVHTFMARVHNVISQNQKVALQEVDPWGGYNIMGFGDILLPV